MNNKIWDRLPFLKKCVEDEKIYTYRGGIPFDIDDDHKKVIDDMNNISGSKTFKVIAVIEGEYILGGTDRCMMIAFVYIDKDSMPFDNGDGTTGFYARVINETWGFEDYGSIGVVENYGLVKRVW